MMTENGFTMYAVRYHLHGSHDTHTCASGPFDYSRHALEYRNSYFKRDPDVSVCWIDRVRHGRTVSRYGAVLKRPAAQ